MSNITMKEIAQLSGVSIGTVDRVLHNRGNVKKEKADRILEICRREGYETNMLARAMMMRKKNLQVAVIINNPEKNQFSRQVKDGLDEVLKEWKDYNVAFTYFFLYKRTAEEEEQYLDEILQSEVPYDGLIIKPVNHQKIKDKMQQIKERNIPIVTCTSDIDGFEPLCFVGQDHVKEGRMAANMLLKCKPDIKELSILSIQKNIFARVQKIDGFTQYLSQANNQICIHEVIEYLEDPKEIYRQTYEVLEKYPDTEALYAHTLHLDEVSRAVEDLKRQKNLIVFSFGAKYNLEKYILSGKITFGIEETSYKHGYLAGEEMLNYLISGKMPEAKKRYVPSNILIEELL